MTLTPEELESRLYEHRDMTYPPMSLKDWGDRLEISPSAIRERIKKGILVRVQ